ncbi:MAG: adenosylhomocysteinase [Candidatus Micrarchaeia archaeon]
MKIKDIGLWREGRQDIEWAKENMPVLGEIEKEFEKNKPLAGITVAACLHITKETAVLLEVLKAGGARVFLCGSNPLSTNDAVAAALAKSGVNVYGWRGLNERQYMWCIDRVLDAKPDVTVDDGADLTVRAHERGITCLGGTEETTTGVLRLRAMEQQGRLSYGVIAVNNAKTKMLFDNRYGTGQSTIDGILRATSILIAGKKFVVAGYGWCGRGIAMRARGMGANVVVCETDPIKALEAFMDGFTVMSMEEAAEIGDIFVTATGNIDVITAKHFKLMRDGAILANSGHFDVEVSVKQLQEMAVRKRRVRRCMDEYTLRDGKKLYLLGEGRLVNLACAEGHPSEVMQMSFGNQALCVEHIVENKGIDKKLFDVPYKIDSKIAMIALKCMGVRIGKLSDKQEAYMRSWESGTAD